MEKHQNFFRPFLLLLLLCCLVGLANSQCDNPPDSLFPGVGTTAYRGISSALQIYTTLQMPCQGYVTSWNFVVQNESNGVANGLHLGVFRPLDATGLNYKVIGDTRINNYAVKPNQWNSYSGFTAVPVNVGDVIGIFYDSSTIPSNQVVVPQSDRFIPSVNGTIHVNLNKTYILMLDSTTVQVGSVLSTSSASTDLRLPGLQAIITNSPTSNTTPSPSQAPFQPAAQCFGTTPTNCQTYQAIYVYSSQTGSCQLSQGCPTTSTSVNSFSTLGACQYYCTGQVVTPPPSPAGQNARCSLQPVQGVDFGSCQGVKSTRYYYNGPAAQCVPYTGCVNQNGNNFASATICQQTCGGTIAPPAPTTPPPSSNVCQLRPVRGVDYGNCGTNNQLTRFYYNPNANQCIGFLGCANPQASNNFATKTSCSLTCTGQLPPNPTSAPPPAPGTNPCQLRPIRNVDFANCGTPNSLTRWYFNPSNSQCVAFQGCNNTAISNNFPTRQSCLLRCTGLYSPPPPPPVLGLQSSSPAGQSYVGQCQNPPIRDSDYGNCAGNKVVRWYYSASTPNCTAFLGCVSSGNTNNYPSRSACVDVCSGATTTQMAARCQQNPANGLYDCSGRAANRTWFDTTNKACTMFQWPVCVVPGGNNFDSPDDCMLYCKSLMQ